MYKAKQNMGARSAPRRLEKSPEKEEDPRISKVSVITPFYKKKTAEFKNYPVISP